MMYLFPAIDLYEGKAVRLLRGDYRNMTVYSDHPLSVAEEFEKAGASFIHMVDLEGARDGTTPNLPIVSEIAAKTGLSVEIGGGIRDQETVRTYLNAGVDRVILGTAAVTDEAFLRRAVATYGEHIVVGADVRDGRVAIKGWLETSDCLLEDFLVRMEQIGVKTVICTDISKDGAMSGTNIGLYRSLSERFSLHIVASGGISTMDDLLRLSDMKLYGAIIGKAYYTGAIDLKEAVRRTKEVTA